MGAEYSHVSPKTISNFDPIRYTGTWHTIAKYPNRWEKDCDKSVVRYKWDDLNEKLLVENECWVGDEIIETKIGKIWTVDKNDPGKLKIAFDNEPSKGYSPYYWIFWTDYNNYSIVGGPSGKLLWVLSRKYTINASEVKPMLNLIEGFGYNSDLLMSNPNVVNNNGLNPGRYRPPIPPKPKILSIDTSGKIPISSKILPANINYYADGEPTNPLAFCLVGVYDTPDSWRWIVPELVKRGYYVIVPFPRGYYPTTVMHPENLPDPGTGAAYWISDMVEILMSLGATGLQRVGKNIFLASDFGAFLMPSIEKAVNKIAGAHVFKAGISASNIPPPVIAVDQILMNPSFEQLKASWYLYLQNVTPLLSNPASTSRLKLDLANLRFGGENGPKFIKHFITEILSPTQNPTDREEDIKDTIKSLYTVPTDIHQIFALARDLYVMDFQAIPFAVPVLYVYSPHDRSIPLFSHQTIGELTVLTKDPSNSPAGAEVLYLACAGHFQNREDVVRFNEGVLKFFDNV